MITNSDPTKIIIETELDEKGFETLRKKLAKTGIDLQKTGKDGEYALVKVEQGATQAASAVGDLSANTEKATDSMKDLGQEARKTSNNIDKVKDTSKNTGGAAGGIRSLTKGFTDMKNAVMAAYAAVKSMINQAVEQRKVDAQALVAIKNNTDEISRQGKSVQQLAKEFKNYANERQKLTGIDNESTQRMQAMLLSYGTAPDTINRVTAAFQDMAAATGRDGEYLIRYWAKLHEAPEEAANALIRYGVKLNTVHLQSMTVEQQRIHILQAIENKHRNQAQAMAEATGGVIQAQAEWGNFTKALGEALIQIFQPLIEGLAKIFGWLSDIPSGIYKVVAGIGAATVALVKLTAVKVAFTKALAAGTTGLKAFAAALTATGIGGILVILGLILAAIMALWEPIKKVGKAIGDFFGGAAREARLAAQEIENIKEKIKELDEQLDKSDGCDKLLNDLSKLKEGTDKYRKAVEVILQRNEDLKRSGLTVASSYREIARAINDKRQEILGASIEARRALVQELEALNEKLTKKAEPLLNVNTRNPLANRIAHAEGAKYTAQVEQNRQEIARQQEEIARMIAADEAARRQNQALAARAAATRTTDTGGGDIKFEPIKHEYDLQALRIRNIEEEHEKRRGEHANRIREIEVESARKLAEMNKYFAEEKQNILESNFAEAVVAEQLHAERKLHAENLATLVRAYNATEDIEERKKIQERIQAEHTRHAETMKNIRKEGECKMAQDIKRVEALDALEKQKIREQEKLRAEERQKRWVAWTESANEWLERGNDLDRGISALEKDEYGKRDWASAAKSAANIAGSFIPGIGPALAGVFSKSVDVFGKLFRSRKKTEAEKLGEALEKAAKRFDRAMSTASFFEKLFGEFDDRVLAMKKQAHDTLERDALRALGLNQNISDEELARRMAAANDAQRELFEKAIEARAGSREVELKSIWGAAQNRISIWEMEVEAGLRPLHEMLDLQQEELELAIERLEVLNKSSNVEKELLSARIALQRLEERRNNMDAGNYMQYAEFAALMKAKQELERAIETGRVRDGTYATVAQQQKHLTDIIDWLKTNAANDTDTIHQFEKELAGLMESFYGTSYTGLTGFNEIPKLFDGFEDCITSFAKTVQTFEDLLHHPTNPYSVYGTQAHAPSIAMPIQSPSYASTQATQAAMTQAVSGIVNSYNTHTENSNNTTINAEAMVPNQTFVEELRKLTKKVYGKDII